MSNDVLAKIYYQIAEIYGINPTGEYFTVICPFHNDTRPSLFININNTVHCASCQKHATLSEFLDFIREHPDKVATGSSYTPTDHTDKTDEEISDFQVRTWMSLLQNSRELVKYFKKTRGADASLLKKLKVGFNGNEIVFPIYDVKGKLKNVRFYNSRALSKIRSIKGRNQTYVFPVKILLENKELFLMEGEGDVLTALALGLPAITLTNGAMSVIPDELLPYFAKKNIIIVYDVDTAGIRGREKVAQQLASIGCNVYYIDLPLPGTEDLNDFTDYIIKQKHTKEDFLSLERKVYFEQDPEDDELPFVRLHYIHDPIYLNTRLNTKAQVISFETTPYVVPQMIKCGCSNDGRHCDNCSFESYSDKIITFSVEEGLLNFIEEKDVNEPKYIKSMLGVPNLCKKFYYDVLQRQNIYELLIAQPVTTTQKIENTQLQPIHCYSLIKLESNREFYLKGKSIKTPKTQKATFIIEEAQRLEEAEEEPKPTLFNLSLDDVLEDLEIITGIKGRRDMLLGMALIMHLPLYFRLGDEQYNGFGDCLIVGDTREGKSVAAQKLIDWYGAGEFITAEHSSYVGLVGGVMKGIGGKQMVKWGRYPANDGGFIVLDECTGISKFDISKMSGLRSSGVAEVIKIGTERANARVRAVWLSNPPDNNAVADYGSGISLVRATIGAPEDIARFLFVQVVAKNEVPRHYQMMAKRKQPLKVLEKEKARLHLKWIWRLDVDHWEVENLDYLNEVAVELLDKYECDFPLINAAEVTIKLAKLSLACAGLLGSIKDGKVVATTEHIDIVAELLNRIYSTRFFNLKRYAEEYRQHKTYKGDDRVELERFLNEHNINIATFISMIKEVQILTDKFLQQSLVIDWQVTNELLAQLQLQHLIKFDGKQGYIKTSKFNLLLEDWERRIKFAPNNYQTKEPLEEVPF